MRTRHFGIVLATMLAALNGTPSPARADAYAVDPVHSGVSFKIAHLGLAWIQGRFDEFSGTFTLDSADPAKTSFAFAINPASVDSNNAKRDEHLRSPDYFNVKQFAAINFVSTAVRPAEGGYDVTGDLTFHGVTKSVTLALKGGRQAEFPKGTPRTGFSTEFVLKRSDYGMVDKMAGVLGDPVYVSISFEGVKK